MRPYISPARIALLVLIQMYCSDCVLPEDDDFVLQLLASYLNDTFRRPHNRRQRHLAHWQRALLHVDLLSSLHSLRAPLQRCFTAAASATAPTATVSAAPLCATLWDELIARLWLQLTTLDDLVPFFKQMSMLIAPTYTQQRAQRELGLPETPLTQVLLDRRAPLGQVVYQAVVEFERLAFSGRCTLWEDLVRYRHQTRTDFKILWPHDDALSLLLPASPLPAEPRLLDAVLIENQGSWGEPATDAVARAVFDRMLKDASVLASSDDADQLIGLLIEREISGFRPDRFLRDAAERIISGSTLIPAQATYYRLAEAWRMNDVSTAYDQLHRYFDLVARQSGGGGSGGGNGPSPLFGYNLGPLTKAVAQRDFGEHPHDLLSMLDSIQAGREARDYGSLRVALLWLYLYARALPGRIRPHQLQGLAGQPTDSDQVLPYVRQDATNQNQQHYHQQHQHQQQSGGASSSAGGSHTHAAQASILEARVALEDGRAPLFAKGRLHEGGRVVVSYNEDTLLGQLASANMVFWAQLGHAPLAIVHGRAFLRTRRHDVPREETAHVAARLALLYAEAGDFGAAKAAMVGGGSSIHGKGVAAAVEADLSLRPQSSTRHVLTYVAAIQALRAGRFDEADDLLQRRLPTGGFPSSVGGPAGAKASQGPSEIDPELATMAALLRVEARVRQGQVRGQGFALGGLSSAAATLDALEAAYDSGVGSRHSMTRMALARCGVYAAAGRGLRLLTFCLRTLQGCLQHRFHQLLWEAAGGAVARLLVAEGEFAAAVTLLDIVLPRVLETGRHEMAATLYELLADAHMGLSGAQAQGRRFRHLSRAWWCLGRAQEHFRRGGSDEAVQQDLITKQRVILAVAKQMEGGRGERGGRVSGNGGCLGENKDQSISMGGVMA